MPDWEVKPDEMYVFTEEELLRHWRAISDLLAPYVIFRPSEQRDGGDESGEAGRPRPPQTV